jgi:hypothetical protein
MSAPSVSGEEFGVNRQNPWLGLASFTEELSGYFFGRDDETAELFRLLKRETLTVLFGQSGLGKTSMLQAGLFPQLRQADFLPVHVRLLHGEDAPALATQVKAALVQRIEAGEVDAPKPDASETLWEYFHRKDVDFWNAKQHLTTPVLVFDQFEEIFTLGRTDHARRSQSQAFLTELADLIENRPPAVLRDKLDRGDREDDRFLFDQESCKVILSLREDYLPDLEGLRPLIRSIMQNRMRIVRMNGTQAHQAVIKPGEALLEEGVAARIVQFVSGAKGNGELDISSSSAESLAGLQVEPALLSVVCRELNTKRQELHLPKITPDLLAGNSSEIIAEFYERSVADLPLAARLFVENRLLTKSGHRDNVALETAVAEDGVALDTIYRLVNRRLLRLEDRFGVQRVEITHDVLTEVIRASRDSRQQQEAAAALKQARITRVRKKLVAFSVGAVILMLPLIFGGYLFIDWCKQQGNWTEEFKVDFSKAPPADPARAKWLKENFVFQNREATSEVKPWLVGNGAMVMQPQEWCWLNNVRIRDDTKVVVDLRFAGKPEAFQICINAKEKLRQWDNNPPGYSCRFGIWEGSMDLITRNEFDRKNDFTSLLVNSALQTGSAGTRDFSLTFQRQGETVLLQLNGKDVHRDTYLLPLLGEHDAQGGRSGYYENIGIRTWGTNVEVLSVSAYRFKLPEKASPIVAGDALVESGDLTEAIEKYKTIAKDYQKISSSISALALTKGYLLTARHEDARSDDFLSELRKPFQFDLWHPFRSDARSKYLGRVLEVETLGLWKKEQYADALRAFPAIFKANPETQIVVECLQTEHKFLKPELSGELLKWVAKTTELAGVDISSFGIEDLGALAGVPSLRGLDCRGNQLSSLDPLRSMNKLRALDCRGNQLSSLDPLRSMNKLRALYCGQNEITTLEPIRALSISELYCDHNWIGSLEPLSHMSLDTLYCRGNRIKDLSPLKGMPIYALDCSYNLINSLDSISGLPGLLELCCGSNWISSLEPLRKVKNLEYLDCSTNEIQTLEPLKDLKLYNLDCSGNRLETLEPFVDAKDPPLTFVFDCNTLPDAEIERARSAWSAKGLRFHVGYCELLLALRHDDLGEVRSLASEFARRSYLFVQKPMRAREAEQFCAKLEGHLVTITSKEENEFLKKITPPEVSCRIGLIVSKGKPRWVTDEKVEEHFVAAMTDFRPSDTIVTWKNGSWLPSQEDKPMPFIVEWE